MTLLGACGGGSGSNAGDNSAQRNLQIVMDSAPAAVTDLRYAHFSFSAADASGYECAIDGADFSPCESPMFDPALSVGNHTFRVRASSAWEETGETLVFSWTVSDVLIDGHDDLVATNVSPSPVDPQGWRGIFRINCDFAHSSYDDPIVFPGQPGAAHLHRFYGNTLVDAHTTMTSLYTQGESSCQGNLLNLSSYWMPALLAPVYHQITGERLLDDQGEPAWQVVAAVVGNDDVAHEVFYYSAGVDDLDSIQPIPPGLRMIAGDPGTGPGEAQDTAIARWHCQTWESDDATNPLFSASIPQCEEPDRVRLDLFFPSCWDGENLDSADHRSHMAYPVNEDGPEGSHCPDSHPVPVVRVSYHLAFGVKPEFTHPLERTSAGWRLASDMYEVSDLQPGGLSLHGDWFNAWHPTIMEALLDNCIKQALDCHDGNLANGLRLSGTRPGTQTEPAVINGGMGH
ncbi:DUF1996 domain-containing protein [Alcanivorax sp. 1008]|nr:DUF1996 domain-containing protein [Alcanivorax sp. 1008]